MYLVRHRLLCKLSVRQINIGHKRYAPLIEHPDALDGAPFGEMSRHDFFDVVCHMDAANVDRRRDPRKAAYSSEIVPKIAELISPEAVDVRGKDVVWAW